MREREKMYWLWWYDLLKQYRLLIGCERWRI